jgi:aldehyde dehydrogenase (NAD+)
VARRKDELVEHLVKAVHDFYGDDPKTSPDCGRIINRKGTERLSGLLGSGTAMVGGDVDLDDVVDQILGAIGVR